MILFLFRSSTLFWIGIVVSRDLDLIFQTLDLIKQISFLALGFYFGDFHFLGQRSVFVLKLTHLCLQLCHNSIFFFHLWPNLPVLLLKVHLIYLKSLTYLTIDISVLGYGDRNIFNFELFDDWIFVSNRTLLRGDYLKVFFFLLTKLNTFLLKLSDSFLFGRNRWL